jgi:hypothetical protein
MVVVKSSKRPVPEPTLPKPSVGIKTGKVEPDVK